MKEIVKYWQSQPLTERRKMTYIICGSVGVVLVAILILVTVTTSNTPEEGNFFGPLKDFYKSLQYTFQSPSR